jgi:hypothetical protein
MSTNAIRLRDALQDWRDTTTQQRYGYASLIDFGGTLVMPTDVLDRIVACAHAGKIATKDDLAKETRWDEVELYSPEILKLIEDFKPPAIMQPPPLQPRVRSSKDRAKTKCSACGMTGHNSEYLKDKSLHLYI